jgi:hypothetical protein
MEVMIHLELALYPMVLVYLFCILAERDNAIDCRLLDAAVSRLTQLLIQLVVYTVRPILLHRCT